jgi:hypothetical protein
MALCDYTQVTSTIRLMIATKSVWDTENPILLEGMPGWESDTKKMKIGDGTSTWTELSYIVDATLTDEQLELLNNINLTDGVVILDSNGLIPLDTLPDQAKSHIKYVTDIPNRDAILEEDRHFIYVVLDASGDPTVESGAATYSWDDTNAVWVKLSEFESIDMDFSSLFHKTTDTLDAISEGISFIKYTPEESVVLDKTMVKDEAYRFASTSPAQLIEIMRPKIVPGDQVPGGTVIGPYNFVDGQTGYIVVPSSSVYLTSKYYGYYNINTDNLGLAHATGTDPHTGLYNTEHLCTHNGADTYTDPNDNPAHYCNNLVHDGCDDYFLPNKNELRYIWENRSLLGIDWGSFSNSYVWSSSQYNSATNVWYVDSIGRLFGHNRSSQAGVIPVRRVVV